MEKNTSSSPVRERQKPGPKPGEGSKVIRIPNRFVPAVESLVAAPHGTLIPSPQSRSHKAPLFSHRVKAGFPSPADDYIEAWLDLNEHLIEHKEATFFVTASGDSMTGAGIQEGNLLVVDRAVEPRNGDIVIAVVDGELTLKRLEKRRGKIRLLAENPAYAPIEFKDGQELTLWGVVTSVIQKIKR
jgi:DNA polymerase V